MEKYKFLFEVSDFLYLNKYQCTVLKDKPQEFAKTYNKKIKLIESEKELSHVVKVNIDNAFTAITIDKEPMAITDSSRM